MPIEKILEICHMKRRQEIKESWNELAEQYGFSSGEAMRHWYKRNRNMNVVSDEKSDVMASENESDDSVSEYDLKMLNLKKERIKVQTLNLDFNRRVREQARADLFEEKIIDAILQKRDKIKVPTGKIKVKESDSTMILSIADQHYGTEFEIKDMFDNVINKYSPEIFEERMWDVFNKTLAYAEKNKFDKVVILDLDDAVENILHISQIISLRYGVVDSIINFAEFMEVWLNELSKYIVVDYSRVKGNHSDLRLLTGKKGDFPHENVSKLITKIISTSLKDNPNITISGHNSIGCVYKNISGFDVLACHGQNEKGNLEQSFKDYMLAYKINIDYLFCGHLHSNFMKEIGVNKEIIQTPSLMGANDYSQGLKKISSSGAKITVLERDYGRAEERNIIFKG